AFKSIGLNAVLKLEEEDPQFKAALRLKEAVDINVCCTLMCLNATISYMLTSTGEEYWNEFVDYVLKRRFKVGSAEEVYALMVSFLQECKGNRLFKPAKFKRLSLMRSSGFVGKVYSGYEGYAYNLEGLRRDLASALMVDASLKTVVFAVKMFYYAFRAATGKRIQVPFSIPIPVDRRISRITVLSGMVGAPQPLSTLIERLVRRREIAQMAWSRVGVCSGIPPLNLDAPLWLLGGVVRDVGQVELGVKALYGLWRGYVDYASVNNLVRELLRKTDG
ncbi:MAG: N-glycosylase/DNA lyase, partial [Candidatus Nezhaarchaeales archaeon]